MRSTGKRAWRVGTTAVLGVGLFAAFAPPAGAGEDVRDPPGGLQMDPGFQADVRKLEGKARTKFEDTFAGVWIDEDDPNGTVFVAFTDDAKESLTSVRKGFDQRELLRPVTAKRSLRTLEQMEERMIDDRALVQQGQLSIPGMPAAYDLEIDVTENVAVATVDQRDTSQAEAAFEQRYGQGAIVQEGELMAPNALCSRSACGPGLRSGLLTYRVLNGQGQKLCSSGFNVRIGVSTVSGILSAGHCTGGIGDSRYHRLKEQTTLRKYGNVHREQVSGRLDAEVHAVGNGFSAKNPCIFVAGNACGKVEKIGTWNDLIVGQSICKAGARTGETCGRVRSKNYSPSSYVPGAEKFVSSDYCAIDGDSGAGVYYRYFQGLSGKPPERRYTAQGIHSGSNKKGATTADCNNPDFRTLFGHVQFIQTAFGVKVWKRTDFK